MKARSIIFSSFALLLALALAWLPGLPALASNHILINEVDADSAGSDTLEWPPTSGLIILLKAMMASVGSAIFLILSSAALPEGGLRKPVGAMISSSG